MVLKQAGQQQQQAAPRQGEQAGPPQGEQAVQDEQAGRRLCDQPHGTETGWSTTCARWSTSW